jgi:hypothetical protein
LVNHPSIQLSREGGRLTEQAAGFPTGAPAVAPSAKDPRQYLDDSKRAAAPFRHLTSTDDVLGGTYIDFWRGNLGGVIFAWAMFGPGRLEAEVLE